MPGHTLAKFGIGHTAFDDAISKAITLATIHTILTSMTLWRSRGTIAPGEVVMSVTSVIAMWGNVSLIRQLRATLACLLRDSVRPPYHPEDHMARLWFAAVSGLDKPQGGFHYVNFDRENYADYMRTRMGKPGAFDIQHGEISAVQSTVKDQADSQRRRELPRRASGKWVDGYERLGR